MGPGTVFTARLGHLLLLHLEGGQIHWKGKQIHTGLFFHTVFIVSLPVVSAISQFILELAELKGNARADFIMILS